MKRIALFAGVAFAAFAASYSWSARKEPSTQDPTPLSAELTEPERLARMGYVPGAQLIVYAFGASSCGSCQLPSTKETFGALRTTLENAHVAHGRFEQVVIVGIAIDVSVANGLEYLASVPSISGKTPFDQVSVGSGWQNEHIVALLSRQKHAELGLPLVVLVERSLTARLQPLRVEYGPNDELIRAVQGSRNLALWAASGMPLDSTVVGAQLP